ncbi:unnamed protein product, partial [Effrenium voratum]
GRGGGAEPRHGGNAAGPRHGAGARRGGEKHKDLFNEQTQIILDVQKRNSLALGAFCLSNALLSGACQALSLALGGLLALGGRISVDALTRFLLYLDMVLRGHGSWSEAL